VGRRIFVGRESVLDFRQRHGVFDPLRWRRDHCRAAGQDSFARGQSANYSLSTCQLGDQDPRGADRPRVERNNEIPGPVPGAFIFDTEDGTISAWAGGLTPFDAAVLAVDNSSVPTTADGAVYKGLAFGTNVDGVFLFATNFRAGTIDVFAPAPAGSTTGHTRRFRAGGREEVACERRVIRGSRRDGGKALLASQQTCP
jgi:hypothetical protein